MKRLRTFIAITPPKDFQKRLAETQDKFKEKNFPVRWEDPEKTHITVVFLGHITQSRMEAAAKATQATAQKFTKFRAQANGISYFYKKGADSIIYLDIKDPEKRFKSLYEDLFRGLAEEDFYPPTRFTPHISLGRLKKQRRPHEKKRMLVEITQTTIPNPGSFEVEKLDVYESIYDSGASKQRYHLIRSFELAGSSQ